MAIASAPPPLEIPSAFGKDRSIANFCSALLNTIYQMWVALYAQQTQSKITTTDATVTEIFSVEVADGTAVMLVARVCAHRTSGSSGSLNDSGFFQVIGAYKNTAGTLTGIGAPSSVEQSDQGTWAVSFTSSGTNAIITVTGATGNHITWQGSLSTYQAGA